MADVPQVAFWERITAFDRRMSLQVRSWERHWLTTLMNWMTRLGDLQSWVFYGFLALVAEGVGGYTFRAIAICALSAALLVQVIKRICRRPRPCKEVEVALILHIPDKYSFPSGHTATAFSVMTAMAWAWPLWGPFFLMFAALIGLSRVYLQAHYPFDVLVGAFVGMGTGSYLYFFVLL